MPKINARDPTGAKSLERKFEKDLTTLFKRFKNYIPRLIDPDYHRVLEAKPNINPKGISDELSSAADEIILKPGKEIVNTHTERSYKQGKKWADKAIEKTIPLPTQDSISVGISFNLPVDKEVIAILQERNNAALKGITDAQNQRITQELTDGILAGESIPQLTNRIQGAVDTIGVNRAEVLARTETMKAVNQGTKQRYEQLGFKSEWLTARDERTCPECGGYNGKITPDMTNGKYPPAHPQCRCTVIPVMGGSP